MPISVKCNCGVALKAPERLAGKTVKCPKCTALLKVPNQNGQMTSPQAAAPRPLADPTAGLTMAPEFKPQLVGELEPGEKVIWFGQPSKKMFIVRRLGYPVGGAIVFFLSLLPLLSVFTRPFDGTSLGLIAISLLFLLLSVALLLSPIFIVKSAFRTWYAITSKKALVYRFGLFRGNTTHYFPDQLQKMFYQRSSLFGGDSGDVVMQTNVSIQRTNYRTRDHSSMASGSRTIRRREGFMALQNARIIEALIREKLLGEKLSPTAAAPTPAPPTQVTSVCPCGARFKAPAKVAGKTVKCPKCARPVKIPALPATTAAPIVADAPTEAGNGMNSVLQTPAGATPTAFWQNKLTQELGHGEQVIWLGHPSVWVQWVGDLVFAGIGLIAAFSLLVAGIVRIFVQFYEWHPGIFFAMSAVVLVMSIGFAAWQLFARWRTARKTAYVLTNRRAMVWISGLLGLNQDVYGPDELDAMFVRKSWFIPGAGDVVFREDTKVVERPYAPGGTRSKRLESKVIRYGFKGIAQVETIAEMVRRTLLRS